MKRNLTYLLLLAATMLMACGKDNSDGNGDDPTPPTPPTDTTKPGEKVTATYDPTSWVAIDALDRKIDPAKYPLATARGDKKVGIFYFLWIGCHGYDTPTNSNDVITPTSNDILSPFDNQKLLEANPTNPAYGPLYAFHHWGQPYMDYYVSNDEWVIRHHAQLLSDAGVDVLFFDVTNGYHYLPVVQVLAREFMKIRAEGGTTPQFAFLLNANVNTLSQTIYNSLYLRGVYKDLWFKWNGKPLMLCNPEEAPNVVKNFFTLRHSWFLWNSSADTWFGNGEDKWPWGGWYPQQAGKHNGERECVSVMPATHPVSNIGRSFNVATNMEPGKSAQQSGKGIYFQSQFERAMKLDPKLLFFTGWNEWVAQRFTSNDGQPMLGIPQYNGGSFFVDQYNHEFSRDIEPLRGDFGDNYYYQMVDFIRQFKGVSAQKTYTRTDTVIVDGHTGGWPYVAAAYADNKGDITHRNHFGYGRIGQLVNNTGRNDIVETRVTNDGKNIYFYVQTASDMTTYKDKNWMRLFITVEGSTAANWEGFQFVVNNTVTDASTTTLEKSKGGWSWEKVSNITYKLAGKEMELSIPMSALGISTPTAFTLDFKWIDNAVTTGDIQECLTNGDSAPNGRFRYRYTFKKQ